ncbi:MAG: aromatic ring-hydroxylating oxygenase subunit alpha [Francisellaceae bacterium]
MSDSDKLTIPMELVNSVLSPIHEANGMPNEFYVSKDYFNFERDYLFSRNWTCVGFCADMPESGSVKPLEFMGLPLLLVCDREGQIKVFHNVCSHRGMKLVSKEQKIQGAIRCPYHSWTYDLDGRLKGTPHIGGIGKHKADGFQCDKHGLKSIRSAIWMGMVFIDLSGEASDFSDAVAPLSMRWQDFIGEDGLNKIRLCDESDTELNVNCNWKLAVENYCEAYHLPWIHPDLNSYSQLEDHYTISFAEAFSGQGSLFYNLSAVSGIDLPSFSSWPQDKLSHAEYIALFPNVLLGIHKDHVIAVVITPLDVEHSIERLKIFYVGEEALDKRHEKSRQMVAESWRRVFMEDMVAVEGMQKGRRSSGFKGGVFSPEMDQATHYFQKWLATQIKKSCEA